MHEYARIIDGAIEELFTKHNALPVQGLKTGADGYYILRPVYNDTKPTPGEDQRVVVDSLVIYNDHVQRTWRVEDMTSQEISDAAKIQLSLSDPPYVRALEDAVTVLMTKAQLDWDDVESDIDGGEEAKAKHLRRLALREDL